MVNSILHPYYSTDEAVFTLTGANTGKVYIKYPLDKNKLRQSVTFTWVDGKNTFDPPAPDESTNKIGLFIADPLMKGALDVKFYYTAYNPDDGTVTRGKPHYIENIQPWKWVYVDYIPDKIKGKPSYAYFEFYKAGTTQWAYDDEFKSKKDISIAKDNPDSFIYFPLEGETGNVYSYVFTADVNTQDGEEYIAQTSLLYPTW